MSAEVMGLAQPLSPKTPTGGGGVMARVTVVGLRLTVASPPELRCSTVTAWHAPMGTLVGPRMANCVGRPPTGMPKYAAALVTVRPQGSVTWRSLSPCATPAGNVPLSWVEE